MSEPSSDTSSDETSDDDVPISHADKPSAAPSSRSTAATAPQVSLHNACRHPAAPGRRECDAIVRIGAAAHIGASCDRSAPYCASELQAAYSLTQAARSAGRGATVGIVAAYGYPAASSDLAVYRKNMGLPSCGTANGCLRIVNQSGRTRGLPKTNPDSAEDWPADQALDLAAVSAICPNCKIVLVQANSNKSSDLAAGVNAAVALGAISVVNPYSGKEEGASESAYRHPGRAIVAAAGNGAAVAAPCSYATVVCVGGTTLLPSESARGWTEHAWGDSGAGCSAYVAKPAWQHFKACKTRAVVDLSAVADPSTGIAVYQSHGGWQMIGGTSLGASIVAATFALGPSVARANAPQWIWRHGASAYRHIAASKGYDQQTGWGAPNGTNGF